MPLAPEGAYRDDSQFVFPERVFGPVKEIRRSLGGGAWENDADYDEVPMRMAPPAYRGGYYEYDEVDFAGPPPMVRPPMRRTPPPMGGMGYQRNFQNAYFKPGPFVEETASRTYRSTPPPPSLVDDMARFRASTPPAMGPMGGMGGGMMAGGMMGATSVRRSSFGRVSPVPTFVAGGASVVSQQTMMGEIISETIAEGGIVGYDVWEEEIVRPVVTPIMETVVRQEPMIVEKRITQETVAPMVVQEMGMAAATTVVEAMPIAAPTVITEMGMAAEPTIVSEYGMAQAPTIIQEMGAAVAPTVYTEAMAPAVTVQTTVMPEPMLMSQWETRAPTIIREADSSLPPVMSGSMSSGAIVVNESMSMEPAPIVVPNESPIFVNEQVPVATPNGIGSFQGGQQPFGPMGGMNNGMNNMGGIPPNSSPFPSNANNVGMFGGTNDLNNIASTDDRKKHGIHKITSKFHRHRK